nr:immunoglobulin heavy chain junction region [Macaca mulatta]MOV91201.1 immunoglobulin heavy chain junction region [Macaca mulatta]
CARRGWGYFDSW